MEQLLFNFAAPSVLSVRPTIPYGWRKLAAGEQKREGDRIWYPKILSLGVSPSFQWCPIVILTPSNGGPVGNDFVIRRAKQDADALDWPSAPAVSAAQRKAFLKKLSSPASKDAR